MPGGVRKHLAANEVLRAKVVWAACGAPSRGTVIPMSALRGHKQL
jgi:hypothetical protein